jgi:hypothetical protein
MAEPSAGTAQVMGSHLLDGSLFGSMAHDPPDHLSLIPEPHTVPLWVTQRKISPSSMQATASHSSTAAFTQPGTGTAHMTSFSEQVNADSGIWTDGSSRAIAECPKNGNTVTCQRLELGFPVNDFAGRRGMFPGGAVTFVSDRATGC